MGKVSQYVVASVSSEDERSSSVPEKNKVRIKKKKRKMERLYLHQKLLKAKKALDKKTKEVKGKPRPKMICNRLLPRPLAGIYRNGAKGKEIRRTQQTKVSLNELHNARLQGDVFKLLNGSEYNSEKVVGERIDSSDARERSNNYLGNILQSQDSVKSPILGKASRKKPEISKSLSSGGPSSETTDCKSAVDRYEEMSAVIAAEGFSERDYEGMCPADPFPAVNNKLRNAYADTFQNQFLSDMIRRGTILNDSVSPSTLPASQLLFGNKNYNRLNETNSTASLPEPLFKPEARTTCDKDAPKSQHLFDLPSLSIPGTQVDNLKIPASNVDASSTHLSEPNTFDLTKEGQHLLSRCVDKKLISEANAKFAGNYVDKHQRRRGAKRPPEKFNLEQRARNAKHVPAILRRCGSHLDKVFADSLKDSKDSGFTGVDKDHQDFAVPSQRCQVDVSNPGLNDVHRIGHLRSSSFRIDPQSPIFSLPTNQSQLTSLSRMTHPVFQKTLMFTKKKVRDVAHCSRVQEAGGQVKYPQGSQICTNCCRCTRKSEAVGQGEHPGFQFQKVQLEKNPRLVSNKLILQRRIHQKYQGDRPLSCVLLDSQDVERETPGSQDACVSCVKDVQEPSILNNVRKLQLLSFEEPEARKSFVKVEDCGPGTVLFEGPPVKYLAVETDSKTRRVPVYSDVERLEDRVGQQKEAVREIVVLPRYEEKFVYVKAQEATRSGVAFEKCSHPGKVVFYEPESEERVHRVGETARGVHVRGVKGGKAGSGVTWEAVQYPSSHGCSILGGECLTRQAIFYRK